MKFLQSLGSKIISQDPSTLEIIESVFGIVIYASLGMILGLFVEPTWLAITLAVLFPILMAIKSSIGKMAAAQNATIQTTKLFTSTMISMFAPRAGTNLGASVEMDDKSLESSSEKEVEND